MNLRAWGLLAWVRHGEPGAVLGRARSWTAADTAPLLRDLGAAEHLEPPARKSSPAAPPRISIAALEQKQKLRAMQQAPHFQPSRLGQCAAMLGGVAGGPVGASLAAGAIAQMQGMRRRSPFQE